LSALAGPRPSRARPRYRSGGRGSSELRCDDRPATVRRPRSSGVDPPGVAGEPHLGVFRARNVEPHHGIGLAIGYAPLRDQLPGRVIARGLAFGVGLFLAQDELVNTVTGLGARPTRYPWQAHARGLIAHAVYGVVTEMTLAALGRRTSGRRFDRTG